MIRTKTRRKETMLTRMVIVYRLQKVLKGMTAHGTKKNRREVK